MATIKSPPHWTLAQRLDAKTDKSAAASDCWLWLADQVWNGYGRLVWQGRKQLAHRLAWESVNGPILPGLQCLHHCDNRRCVNPAHLFLGTARDNVRDCMKKGRRAPMVGSANNWAKIDEKIAGRVKRELRRHRAVDVARKLGVGLPTVYSIKYGHSWKHA